MNRPDQLQKRLIIAIVPVSLAGLSLVQTSALAETERLGNYNSGKSGIHVLHLADNHGQISMTKQQDSNPFALMKNESLGKLKIDLPASEVIKLLGKPARKSELQYWGADGRYHQDWYYPDCGITLNMVSNMVSPTEDEPQTIAFVNIESPSTLETKRGIGIGSSVNDVISAYGEEQESETSIPSQHFVAGSIYGGLMFSFENGYVSEIFLGAAAE